MRCSRPHPHSLPLYASVPTFFQLLQRLLRPVVLISFETSGEMEFRNPIACTLPVFTAKRSRPLRIHDDANNLHIIFRRMQILRRQLPSAPSAAPPPAKQSLASICLNPPQSKPADSAPLPTAGISSAAPAKRRQQEHWIIFPQHSLPLSTPTFVLHIALITCHSERSKELPHLDFVVACFCPVNRYFTCAI